MTARRIGAGDGRNSYQRTRDGIRARATAAAARAAATGVPERCPYQRADFRSLWAYVYGHRLVEQTAARSAAERGER